MTLAFDYMVLADALTGSAVRLRSVLERDAPNVNARSEDADWLDSLAAVCRERAADITPTATDETVFIKVERAADIKSFRPDFILIDDPQPAEAAADLAKGSAHE